MGHPLLLCPCCVLLLSETGLMALDSSPVGHSVFMPLHRFLYNAVVIWHFHLQLERTCWSIHLSTRLPFLPCEQSFNSLFPPWRGSSTLTEILLSVPFFLKDVNVPLKHLIISEGGNKATHHGPCVLKGRSCYWYPDEGSISAYLSTNTAPILSGTLPFSWWLASVYGLSWMIDLNPSALYFFTTALKGLCDQLHKIHFCTVQDKFIMEWCVL